MLKNYFITAWRNLKKHKIFSVLNILGLAIGMAACLLILQYVSFKLSYDQFHDHVKDIYRVANDRYQNGKLIQHGTITYSGVMLVKNELLSTGVATSVTKSSAPLTEGWSNTWGLVWPGKDPDDKTIFDRYMADDEIVKTAGMQLVMGRDFDLDQFPTDSTAIIVNESALKHMKLKEPLGAILNDNGIDWHVIGVVKDFILRSPYEPVGPLFIAGAKGWFNVVQVRFNNTQAIGKNVDAMEKIFKKYNPQYPFEYHFIDEEYARKFINEKRVGTLASLFAGLAIFISCLGLFGLAAYMAEARLKEIGVRKVLGASVSHIVTLLSKDFLKLVVIALLLASPLAWYFMNKWLQGFSYRVTIGWWIFVVAGLTATLVALLTVSYQAIKAAVRNPVRSLRSE